MGHALLADDPVAHAASVRAARPAARQLRRRHGKAAEVAHAGVAQGEVDLEGLMEEEENRDCYEENEEGQAPGY
jgi:hypothetical protein